MKIYITTYNRKSVIVRRETTLQSVMSDLFTMLVIVVLFACDIAFSLLVVHSVVFDMLACGMFFFYLYAGASKKRTAVVEREKIGEEVDRIINSKD